MSSTGWICSECGEPAQEVVPDRLMPVSGPVPGWSHLDGWPLCPVVGPNGYEPAQPQRA